MALPVKRVCGCSPPQGLAGGHTMGCPIRSPHGTLINQHLVSGVEHASVNIHCARGRRAREMDPVEGSDPEEHHHLDFSRLSRGVAISSFELQHYCFDAFSKMPSGSRMVSVAFNRVQFLQIKIILYFYDFHLTC